MSNCIDLTGKTFGRLTVIRREKNNKQGKAMWLCKCCCGNIKVIEGYSLRKGVAKSCGCYRKEVTQATGKQHRKYNKKQIRLHNIILGIQSRCYNPKDAAYKNYGRRGIKVCDEWLEKENGFINFYNWAMNNGYRDDLTIDRINNNGNYEPNNCRWVTMKEQQNNRRNNKIVMYKNKKYTLSQLSEKLKINSATLSWRIRHNWGEKELNLEVNLANNKIRKEIQ